MTERVDTMAAADVVLIGGGVMSATLGVILHQLDPSLKIQIVEALAEVAKESSNPWNNAGTGHAALCELNYTQLKDDGSVNCVTLLLHSKMAQLYWSARIWCILRS